MFTHAFGLVILVLRPNNFNPQYLLPNVPALLVNKTFTTLDFGEHSATRNMLKHLNLLKFVFKIAMPLKFISLLRRAKLQNPPGSFRKVITIPIWVRYFRMVI